MCLTCLGAGIQDQRRGTMGLQGKFRNFPGCSRSLWIHHIFCVPLPGPTRCRRTYRENGWSEPEIAMPLQDPTMSFALLRQFRYLCAMKSLPFQTLPVFKECLKAWTEISIGSLCSKRNAKVVLLAMIFRADWKTWRPRAMLYFKLPISWIFSKELAMTKVSVTIVLLQFSPQPARMSFINMLAPMQSSLKRRRN